jgi:6-pyruvoyltetrahydropterin/6-carboxytetrahydropterin synthase
MSHETRVYKYVSTKEYHDSFPCAYRQWRADSHCNLIHGYSFSMKFYFGTDDLDVRNWAADYGGLKELKGILEDQFDHTLLVAETHCAAETGLRGPSRHAVQICQRRLYPRHVGAC